MLLYFEPSEGKSEKSNEICGSRKVFRSLEALIPCKKIRIQDEQPKNKRERERESCDSRK